MKVLFTKQIHKEVSGDYTIESSQVFPVHKDNSQSKAGSRWFLGLKSKVFKRRYISFPSSNSPYTYNYLQHACRTGNNIEVERALKYEDIDSNDGVEYHGVTPLHVALIHEKYDVAVLLLQKGASVTATANNGWTPLHIASSMGCIEIVECLLKVYKADYNARDSRGWTPLFVAIFRGHLAVVQLFLGKVTYSQDFFKDMKDYYGQTLLMIACQGGHEDIVELLLALGVCDFHARDLDGWTAFNHAEKKENSENICQLLKKYSLQGLTNIETGHYIQSVIRYPIVSNVTFAVNDVK
jgi:ankyrin repeat protein